MVLQELFMQLVYWLLFAAVIGFACWMIATANAAFNKRGEALNAIADECSWSFDPDYDEEFPERFKQFDLFRTGDCRMALNTMRGALGRPAENAAPIDLELIAGDYRYRSGGGEKKQTRHVSYLLLQPPPEVEPKTTLTIRRERASDKLKSGLGLDDIDFESKEFSDRFHVASGNKRFAYQVLHPRVIELMLDTDPPRLELSKGWFLVTDEAEWSPEEFRERVEWTRRFFSLWPRHLRRK